MAQSALRNLPLERMNARRARAGMEAFVPQAPTKTAGQAMADMLGGMSIPLSVVPVAGDVAGLGADAAMYAAYPEERTLGNAAMTLAGIVPGIPGAAAMRAGSNAVGDASRWSETTAVPTKGQKVIDIPLARIEHGEAAMPGGTLTQPYAEEMIREYASRSTPFPPIEVLLPDTDDPFFMVIDGSRRLEAAKRRGDKTIQAIVPLDFNIP